MKFGFTIDDMRKQYPEVTDDLLERLRSALEKENLPTIPDTKLAIFAHSCYFDFEATICCIRSYYQLRMGNPDIFGNVDPEHEKMQYGLDKYWYVSLPVTTPEGYRIIIHRLKDTCPENYIMEIALKMLVVATEIDLYAEGCCDGTIFILDAKGVRLGHLMRISLGVMRAFLEYVQSAMPVRLKGVYVLNAVWFTSKILAIVRPFLKKDVYDLIRVYAGDVSEVHSVLPPKCLPKDYGGELASICDLHDQFREKLHNRRDFFLEEESLYRSYYDRLNKSNDKCQRTTTENPIEQISHSNSDS